MANPRKFSEKIALQKQKQAEGTAEFEKIMNEVKATRVLDNTLNSIDGVNCSNITHRNIKRGNGGTSYVGGSSGGGGGSGGSGSNSGASGGGGTSPDTSAGGIGPINSGGSPTPIYRESRGRSVGVGPMRRPAERKQDRSPYGSVTMGSGVGTMLGVTIQTQTAQNSYLSPPIDTSWRRSNSDSALHQTLNMVESNYGISPNMIVATTLGDMNALHANYHQTHNHQQRSHSPHIGRNFSPQAQKRKNQLMLQQQQQHQQQQQQHQHQQAQQLQDHQLLQLQHQRQVQQHQLNNQQQQQQVQQQQTDHEQIYHNQPAELNYTAKYTNTLIPANIMFKSLQEQTNFGNNTGSLPDLTSVHYNTTTSNNADCTSIQTNNSSTLLRQQQQQQQHNLSPMLAQNNDCHQSNSRDQTSSPFNSTSNVDHQQQHNLSNNSIVAVTVQQTCAVVNAQASSHHNFNHLTIQNSPNPNCQTKVNVSDSGGSDGTGYGILPTLGANNTTRTANNMTNYRQPINPPSPGSSPGLLTSTCVASTDLNISAPSSPIRHVSQISNPVNDHHQHQHQHHIMQNTFVSNDGGRAVGSSNAVAGSSNNNNNSLNNTNSYALTFHNHFEQFHLGDTSNQSQQTNYETLEFEDFGDTTANEQQEQQSNQKLLDFVNDLATSSEAINNQHNDICNVTSTGNIGQLSNNNICHNSTNIQNNSNNNTNIINDNNKHNINNNNQFRRRFSQQQQINNSVVMDVSNNSKLNTTLSSTSSSKDNNNETLTYASKGLRQDMTLTAASSPLNQCVSSPSSPIPIITPAQLQQQQQLSITIGQSPHQSPLHSPHQPSSPLSVASPSLMLGSVMGNISPIPSPTHHLMSSTSSSPHHLTNNQTHHNSQLLHHTQQHQQQQQDEQQSIHNQNATNTNIPQIIFSDYSSSRDIFDHLDLDLGQIDEPGLQMLSDQGPIMIADPTIEDSFRRDLN